MVTMLRHISYEVDMTNGYSVFDLLDGNDSGLRDLQNSLVDLRARVKAAMDQGLNPPQFACAQKVLAAVDNGIEAVASLYDKLRG